MGGMKVQARDSLDLAAPPERVFDVLLNMAAYGSWWPRPVVYQSLRGGRARVSNGPLVWWTVAVTRSERPKSIELRYDGGAWKGAAVWTLEPAATGTRVTYTVDLNVNWWWLRLLGRVAPFARLHSWQLIPALRALGRYASGAR